ncbi:MAG: DUF3084 domain-containing protein [Aphanocapsa lilacina HA4352-LM1]|jgi:uncharacterized protein (DUF3084 family)|nr:DUF3084 domain-containing protein [Aphanocapsa lilacina HA4352-LM1]
MIAGFLLILAVLILGGGIATVGDRIGSMVGKKRLSLFKLRPRDTATLVTVFTGVMIAGVSLALVLLVSDRVQFALFNYDQVQSRLRDATRQQAAAEKELLAVQGQRTEERRALQSALAERRQAETNLQSINRQLTEARSQQEQSERKLAQNQKLLATLETQKAAVQKNAQVLRQAVQTLNGEQRRLATSLQRSRKDLVQLARQKKKLERENETLFYIAAELAKKVAASQATTNRLRSRTELIFEAEEAVAKAKVPGGRGMAETQRIFDEFLSEVQKQALKAGAQPEPQAGCKSAVCMSAEEARRILQQLAAPGDHALQLISIDNSLKGEPVWVFGQVRPNQLLFEEGRVIAARQIDRNVLNDEEKLRVTLVDLFNEANRQARDAGILTSGRDAKVGEFLYRDLERMIEELRSQPGSGAVTLQAVSKQDVYTLGPLSLKLVAIQNGRILSKAG